MLERGWVKSVMGVVVALSIPVPLSAGSCPKEELNIAAGVMPSEWPRCSFLILGSPDSAGEPEFLLMQAHYGEDDGPESDALLNPWRAAGDRLVVRWAMAEETAAVAPDIPGQAATLETRRPRFYWTVGLGRPSATLESRRRGFSHRPRFDIGLQKYLVVREDREEKEHLALFVRATTSVLLGDDADFGGTLAFGVDYRPRWMEPKGLALTTAVRYDTLGKFLRHRKDVTWLVGVRIPIRY